MAKKQSQSKPICLKTEWFVIPVKTGIHTLYDSGFRINRLCEASGITYERDSSLRCAPFRMTDSGIFEMIRFEKTKPICQRANRCKLLFERKLWQYNDLRGSKKQSQLPAFSRKF